MDPSQQQQQQYQPPRQHDDKVNAAVESSSSRSNSSISGDLSGNANIPNLMDTHLWVQQFQTPTDLLNAARDVFDEMNAAYSMQTTTTATSRGAGGDAIINQTMGQSFLQQSSMEGASINRAPGFIQAMGGGLEGDVRLHQYFLPTCEATLVEIYQTLQREGPIANPHYAASSMAAAAAGNTSTRGNYSNKNYYRDLMVRMTTQNINSTEILRFTRDLKENELKLFRTVMQNFDNARSRCQEAVHTMEAQATYRPIKEQYLKLQQIPLFAYGDALERLQAIQDDLMNEITVIELILFCGTRGTNLVDDTTVPQQHLQQYATAPSDFAARLPETVDNSSPSFLMEAPISEISTIILQQLSPGRKSGNKSVEMSPMRKAMRTISLQGDDDEDNNDDATDGDTNTLVAPQFPVQDIRSRIAHESSSSSVLPKGENDEAEWKTVGGRSKASNTFKTTPRIKNSKGRANATTYEEQPEKTISDTTTTRQEGSTAAVARTAAAISTASTGKLNVWDSSSSSGGS